MAADIHRPPGATSYSLLEDEDAPAGPAGAGGAAGGSRDRTLADMWRDGPAPQPAAEPAAGGSGAGAAALAADGESMRRTEALLRQAAGLEPVTDLDLDRYADGDGGGRREKDSKRRKAHKSDKAEGHRSDKHKSDKHKSDKHKSGKSDKHKEHKRSHAHADKADKHSHKAKKHKR
jgi:hypothetical protein